MDQRLPQVAGRQDSALHRLERGEQKEREMMPGDMPCNEECYNTLCQWCLDGRCLDNCTCAGQTSREEYEGDKEFWEEVKE